MKTLLKIILTISFLSNGINALAQKDTLQVKLDSILLEADLMYKHEKVAWNSSDLAREDKILTNDFGGYQIYHQNDTIIAVYFDSNQDKALARYYFKYNNLSKPFNSVIKKSDLSKNEKQLISIRMKVLEDLNKNSETYGFSFLEGYTPNLVMLSNENKYHFYLIMGTTKLDIIPFGNDYFFEVNDKGKVLNWRKFHKTLIETSVAGQDGNIPISFIHSHLPMTPLISATDICTFRLYGVDLFDKKSFIVTSTALRMNFIYDADTNKIEATKL